MDMTLSDDELGAELFTQLVGRLEVAAKDDATVTVTKRGPAVFSVSRHGDELIIHPGAGQGIVLAGHLTWKHRSDRDDQDAPWEFRLERVPDNPQLLQGLLDGHQGSAEDMLDHIVETFLKYTDPAFSELERLERDPFGR